jgi:exonuclease VII small subunit
MPIEQCKKNIHEARQMLEQVNKESDKLDDYVSSKKQ